MALGAKRSYIMGPFLLEALFITFAGGLIGILLSIGIIGGLASIKTQNEALEFIGRPTFSWVVALTTVALLGFIGFLAGYFPSRRAASVNPAESLRYE
jgi:putative ABC transport system permease protein